MSKYVVEHIKWVDSAGNASWTSVAEVLRDKLKLIESVGFVLNETDDCVVIVGNIDEAQDDEHMTHIAHHMFIPKVAIKSRTVITEIDVSGN